MGTGSKRSKNMGILGTWEHGNTIAWATDVTHDTVPHGNCGLAIGPERECRGLGLEQWSEQE
jgi:hypothetical protein